MYAKGFTINDLWKYERVERRSLRATYCGEVEVVENATTSFPDQRRPIFLLTFVYAGVGVAPYRAWTDLRTIEPVDLSDLPAFMIPA